MKNKMLIAIAALCVVGGLVYGFFGYHPLHDDYWGHPYDAAYYDPYYAPAYDPNVQPDLAAGHPAAIREQRVQERVAYPKNLQQSRPE